MDGDSLARLMYLTLLGAAVAAWGFASYRGRLAAGVQHALLWGLIVIGLVAAYGLREEVSRALGLAPTLERAGEALVLRRGLDGHFHLDAEVNGARIGFLVDTGATDLVLTPADARRAGIDLDRLAYTRTAMTANGPVRIAPVRLERVALPGVEARDVPAVVGGAGLFGSLMGMSFLDRFSRVSVEGDRMTLEP